MTNYNIFSQSIKLFILLALSVTTINSQALQTAGSAAAVGGISQFYYDGVDNLLYGCGTVKQVDGMAADQIVAWNGKSWTAKGNISNLITFSYPGLFSIGRANDTLFVLGAIKSGTFQVELSYWDGSDWAGTGFGVSYSNDPMQLIEYNNSLFLIGANSGSRLDSVNFIELGTVAVWNGFEFKNMNFPGQCESITSGVIFNGKLYVGDYFWNGTTWEAYGLDLKNCTVEFLSITNYKNQLAIATVENGITTVQLYDGTNFTTIVTGLEREIRDMVSLGDKLAVTGNFDTFDGNNFKEVAFWDGTEWSGISEFGGNGGTIGNFHGQLIISSPLGYPIYAGSTPLGSIAKYGDPTTGVKDKNISPIPNEFNLEQNYPNPFNPSTTIKYSVPSMGNSDFSFVRLNVFNALGEIVATLVNESKAGGNYSVEFDAGGLASGIYFYSLTAGSTNIIKKMILLK